MGVPSVDRVSSFDSTMLASMRVRGGAKTPLLIVNAVGTNVGAWKSVLDEMDSRRPVYTWDLRGLYDSEAPRSDRIDAPAHAEDALAVADHYGLQRPFVAAWSTGCRIALELAVAHPERVAGLVVVAGGYGQGLARALRLEVGALLPTLAGVAKHFSGSLGGLARTWVGRPEFGGLIRHSGFVAATADTPRLVELFRGAAECDTRSLLATFEAVAGDPIAEALSSIQSPALLVAGGRDPFTPRSMIDEMARAIAGARTVVYPGATHFLLHEFPARLAGDIDAFLADVGPGRARTRRGSRPAGKITP